MAALDRHEKSKLLCSSLQLIPNQRNETVLEQSHKRKMEVMKENRVAFVKIFTSLRFLGCRGLAIKGKEEATSNFAMLLQEYNFGREVTFSIQCKRSVILTKRVLIKDIYLII